MRTCAASLSLVALGGCSGVQSALDPAGRDAEWIAGFFLLLTGVFALIWLLVVALALYAPHARAESTGRSGRRLILGGGVALPLVVLSVLAVTGFTELPRILTPGSEEVRITITGHQWWWRVRYSVTGRPSFDLANELHLPVGRRLTAHLAAADVIHSFWIPPVAGKVDMIPGRINRVALEPTRTGTFRGACAEFCGPSHARMNLVTVVADATAFDSWLAEQARPAAPPSGPAAQRGHDAFFERGCSTCHTIRGTGAVGIVGPDLTHVGSRRSLAAGTLPTGHDDFRRWISGTDRFKPGVHMPAFAHLTDGELDALATYLRQLQ